MLIVRSRNGVPIRLTDERWKHIMQRHTEMADQYERVLETVSEPDLIQEGDFGELLGGRFYSTTPLTSKFLVIAYREVSLEDGFILTAYFTSRMSRRRVTIWKR
ncbi:MAG: hypothetical protein HY731_11830 [Candidatus Tectomicrobia bacterium]|nr:hypothetical protein [Candidatus Tectomicrobia bacterium]